MYETWSSPCQGHTQETFRVPGTSRPDSFSQGGGTCVSLVLNIFQRLENKAAFRAFLTSKNCGFFLQQVINQGGWGPLPLNSYSYPPGNCHPSSVHLAPLGSVTYSSLADLSPNKFPEMWRFSHQNNFFDGEKLSGPYFLTIKT